MAIDTSGLNDAQREAVFHTDGPLLVLAGAGSGKTRVVTTRIARLLLGGESPRSILAVTFTNKAAKEMKERLMHLAGKHLGRGVWVSTFHALCARLLRRDAHRIGVSTGFVILDDGDQLAQLSRVCKAEGKKLTEKEPRLVLSRIGNWKNLGLRTDVAVPDSIVGGDPISLLATQLWLPYAQHLRTLSALDFDDLLIYCRELLEKTPDVKKRYQALFKYIHIDEYQDTNPLQLDIVKLLVGAHQNICVVGDDDQAIYAFRGADLENILAFDRMYTPCTVVKLEQNYRSTGLILDAANAVIRKNTVRKDKTLYSALGAGKPVEIAACEDGDAEAEMVGSRIFDLVIRDQFPAEHVAILYRSAPQSRLFEEALRLRGVPYRVIGGMEFFQRREVKDTLAYLSVMAREHDEIAFRRALTTPSRGIGEKTLDRLIALSRERNESLLRVCLVAGEALALKPAQTQALIAFATPLIAAEAKLWRVFKDPEGDVALLVRRAIDAAGLSDLVDDETDLAAREKLQECIEEVVDAFAAFVDRLRDASENPDLETSHALLDDDDTASPLLRFLDRVALDDDKKDDKKNDKNEEKKAKGKVQLMSLHASKGLEFPVVFLVGCEEGLLPHRRVIEESGPKGIEEERRLAYVGITRAQRTLVCSYAKLRRKRHEMVGRKRCRFLDDVPTDCTLAPTPEPAVPEDPAAAFFAAMRSRFDEKA